MPRRKKIVEHPVKTLIRDYTLHPLKPGEDLQLCALRQKGLITKRQLAQALWDADEAAFERSWKKKNQDSRTSAKGFREEDEGSEGDEDGDDDDADPVA